MSNDNIDIISPIKNLLGKIAKASSASIRNLSTGASNLINNIGKSNNTESEINKKSSQDVEQSSDVTPAPDVKPPSNIKLVLDTPPVEIDYNKMHNYYDYPFQTRLDPLYVGCLNDDPLNPIMDKKLGIVNNQLECINLGLANKLKYVGLIEGEKCMGTNKIKEESFVTKYSCDYPCNEANIGYCGGFYYNQVYKIDENIINNLNNESSINNKKIESFQNIPVTNKLKSVNEIEFIIWVIILLLLINIIISY